MIKNSLREKILREDFNISLTDSSINDSLIWFRCKYRDEFETNLEKVIRFIKKQKISEENIYRITAIVGELGNNSFDHNLGKWPNGFMGNFAILRYNKKERLLEIIVIDLGIGFKESLKQSDPAPESEIEAIKMGLAGVTGRVGEKRGNGLRTVAAWIKKYYQGEMRIQSNEGIVLVDKEKVRIIDDKIILGTEVYLRLRI